MKKAPNRFRSGAIACAKGDLNPHAHKGTSTSS